MARLKVRQHPFLISGCATVSLKRRSTGVPEYELRTTPPYGGTVMLPNHLDATPASLVPGYPYNLVDFVFPAEEA
jgi:hypothetical protein